MKEEIIEKIKKYSIYILIFIIICLVIVIGFIYGENTTKKVEQPLIEEKDEIVEEEKSTYIVDIKGEVKNPGVYEIEENKRIMDVIKMAGGLTKEADTNYINLSKKIKDEMVIIIYSKKEIEEYKKGLEEENIKEVIKYEIIEKECVCPNTLNDACIEETEKIEKVEEDSSTDNKEIESDKTTENELVNINTATIQQLQTLSGVGESKAKSIIEYREENKFTKIEDIKNVSGIGDSLFEKIKDYITI